MFVREELMRVFTSTLNSTTLLFLKPWREHVNDLQIIENPGVSIKKGFFPFFR